MPIELVPKEKVTTKIPLDPFKIFFYLLLGVALGLTVSWLYLYAMESRSKKKLSDLELALAQHRSREVVDLEKKVLDAQLKVETYTNLLNSHRRSSFFFDFLSKLCHKRVYFSKSELDLDGNSVQLVGETEDFSDLRKQILIFEEEELIKEVTLESVSLNEKGGLTFNLDLELSPKVFKEKLEIEETEETEEIEETEETEEIEETEETEEIEETEETEEIEEI